MSRSRKKRPPAKVSPTGRLRKKFGDRKIAVSDGGMEIYCWCNDVAYKYGNPQLLVTPCAGEGCEWVSAERCRIMEGKRETPPDEPTGIAIGNPLAPGASALVTY